MTASDLRARARQNLSGNWALSIGVAVVACLLGGMVSGTRFLPEWNWEIPVEFLQKWNLALEEGLQFGNLRISFGDGFGGLSAFLLGGVIQLGYAEYLLKQHDGKPFQFNDLFSKFDRFGQGFAQLFLRRLYITLWSLLLVIPGIIASYAYALTPFLMADFPQLSASEAISQSKDLMDGHKWELFVLELSFIGWTMLAAISANLGFIALNPYTNAARAAFYRNVLKQAYQANANSEV